MKYTPSRKIIQWIMSTVCLLSLVFFLGAYFLQHTLPGKLKELVSKQSNGLYTLYFRSMDISLWRGKASLNGLRLRSNEAIYNGLPDSIKPAALYNLDASGFDIDGVSVLTYFFKKRIKADLLKVERPHLQIIKMRYARASTQQKHKDLYQHVPASLRGAAFRQIELNGITLSIQDKRTHGTNSYATVGKFSILVDQMKLDSSTSANHNKPFFAKDIQVNAHALTYAAKDAMYHFGIGRLHLSTKERLLAIDKLTLTPRYPEMAFSRRLVYQGDRYDIRIPGIRLEKIDFSALETSKTLAAQRLNVEKAALDLFVNKGMPPDPHKPPADFPAIAFQKLALPICIDHMYIKKSAIFYREYNPASKRIGGVNFQRLDGTISNITNIPARLKKDKWVKFRLASYFMNAAQLKLSVNIDMTDPNAAFNYHGSLAPHDLQFANAFLQPLSLVKVEHGTMQGLTFRIAGNKSGASSQVRVLYSDLRVATLREDNGKIEKKGIFSLFINWLKLNNSNPSEKGKPARQSSVWYNHPPESSFFNLVWKSLMAGLDDIVIK